ncbi:MAG TPA: PspA/IM30 family protein [Planctomycetes bacterium]|nr:PspA/IM30 family protein [Fuerstiella sp.]HIK95847.1 PspA/IM30 family protein [Planctomycetota bacterium]
MKWLTQFSLVMRSSLTSLKDKIEDPERMLYQLIIDMEEELDRVRCSVAEAVADEIQMRKRSQRERAEAEKWMERAAAAMKRGDEVTAKSALEQKMSAQQRTDQYSTEHQKQKAEVEKLQASVRDLEDKIRQAKQKKTLLTARMARATSTQKINSAMERSHSQSAFAQFNRLEAKVDREEAMTEAWDRMDGKDPDADELARQFEVQERAERVTAELEQLKAESATD